ncbi:MAG: thiamine-phosphate pyrophosphorylase [Epsilonproteobacteria bacterium]|nr:thiamine-phosphate pyrophosphorylase [Campylobacterota bacterium]
MNRTIDANLNRLKEGLRVVEDILRYEYSSPLAKELKNLRHIKIPNYEEVIKSRNSTSDILKPSTKSELKRESIKDVIISNLKRAQESSRVLEELYKLIDTAKSEEFKNIRYALYEIEKKILNEIIQHS